jgi:predicted transport protein
MNLYKLNKNKLSPIDQDQFKLEKDIQNIVEQNTEEIFNLQLVKSEFAIKNYRIDSLCFDQETNSFVIIEYKKGSSYSVIDQGFSYLSTMLNNKSDFVLEYNESTNSELKRDQVDWTQSRVIFISTSFNSFQTDSVNFKDIPFELYQVKRFKGGVISINQISSKSKESIKSVKAINIDNNKVLDQVSVYDEDSQLKGSSQRIRELYFQLKERMSSWQDVKFKTTKNYVSVGRGNKTKIYINIQKERLKLHLLRRIDFKGNVKSAKVTFTIDDPKKIHTLYKSSHKEQYQILLKDEKDIDYVVSLLRQKYDS